MKELETLRAELADAKARLQRQSRLSLKVSQKGAVSLYGLQRFPVTLYAEQWLRVLDAAADIRGFCSLHESELASK